MSMTALDTCKVMIWLEKVKPGATMYDLQKQIELHFGEIEWDSQMGYGEGLIIAKIGKIEGYSGGLCTSEEAMMELLVKLLNHEAETKANEDGCDWI